MMTGGGLNVTSRRGKRREGRCFGRLLISQAVLDGVPYKLGGRPHLHLFQNACAVGAHGGTAQRKLPGDLFDRSTTTEEAENLKLPVGEQFVWVSGGRPFVRVAQQLLHHALAEVFPALQNFSHRSDEVVGGGVFRQVARRAGP